MNAAIVSGDDIVVELLENKINLPVMQFILCVKIIGFLMIIK